MNIRANKTLFSNSQTAFLPDNFQPNYIDMPSIGTSCHSDEEDWPASVTFAEDESLVPHPSPNQLGVRCLTLSLKPMNYWQTLSQLDLIKVCAPFLSYYYLLILIRSATNQLRLHKKHQRPLFFSPHFLVTFHIYATSTV
jgi:hypothetical protein